MNGKKVKILLYGVIIIIVILLLWSFFKSSPKEDAAEGRVSLRTDIKQFGLDDMLKGVKSEINSRMTGRTDAGEDSYTGTGGDDTAHADNSAALERIQALIRENERDFQLPEGNDTDSSGTTAVPTAASPSKKAKGKQKAPKAAAPDSCREAAPEEKKVRREFNSIQLVRMEEKNVIRAFVHSTQTVMTGSTLKMQVSENCLTDDGQRIRKGTPVYGEVTGIDGERVLVKITSINIDNNILPFKKEVYSKDAMEGIYVPGNAKAETVKEAEAAGIEGANANISGGFDIATQIAAGAANSVINATKSVAGKNVRKIKVTIKTNYQILLREDKKKG